MNKALDLSENDVEILNSKIGLKHLLAQEEIDLAAALKAAKYENTLRQLQVQLVDLQRWVIESGQRIIVLFEGRDAAGKGGAIRRITAHINPRHFRIVALPKPSDEEKGQWYFQRYVNQLPKPGEIVFFDRSWYNRAVVEPVNEFCSEDEYRIFMSQVNEFERMITESGCHLVKLYFSISRDEQKRRFKDIKNSPLKRWKMTSVDKRAQKLWDAYTSYKDKMFEATDTSCGPWHIIKADDKMAARLEALQIILDEIPYQ